LSHEIGELFVCIAEWMPMGWRRGCRDGSLRNGSESPIFFSIDLNLHQDNLRLWMAWTRAGAPGRQTNATICSDGQPQNWAGGPGRPADASVLRRTAPSLYSAPMRSSGRSLVGKLPIHATCYNWVSEAGLLQRCSAAPALALHVQQPSSSALGPTIIGG
jgi:hypothetical protein